MDMYSKRRKRELGQTPDVYTYDDVPKPLRNQLVRSIRRMFSSDYNAIENGYRSLVDILAEEYGKSSLSKTVFNDANEAQLAHFVEKEASAVELLDVVEIALSLASNSYGSPDRFRDEVNNRFQEHCFGYQIQGLQVIRIDSQLLHKEAVQPALRLLDAPGFAGANQEFLNAHEHHRHGRYKEAIVECLKTMESTLKIICRDRKWQAGENDPCKRLLTVVFENGLIPEYQDSSFANLRCLLESSIPTVRNKTGGHGQGGEIKPVPLYLSAFVLHQTAATVVYLTGC